MIPPFVAGSDSDAFVALETEERLIGGAVLWFTPNRRFAEKAHFTIQVRETHRRRGIGRALLNSIIASARDNRVEQLRSSPVEEKSAGHEFLVACGFHFGAPTVTYEAPIEDFATVIRPIYQRLEKRGKIPAGARIVPLTEASRDEVCRLVLDNLGFSSQHVAERLRGTEHGFSQTISRVALLDGKLIGALLITYQKALASFDATAVVPQHRHTWANAALKYFAIEELIARGVERMRFSANTAEHPDTAKFARRINARVLKTIYVATLDLDPKE